MIFNLKKLAKLLKKVAFCTVNPRNVRFWAQETSGGQGGRAAMHVILDIMICFPHVLLAAPLTSSPRWTQCWRHHSLQAQDEPSALGTTHLQPTMKPVVATPLTAHNEPSAGGTTHSPRWIQSRRHHLLTANDEPSAGGTTHIPQWIQSRRHHLLTANEEPSAGGTTHLQFTIYPVLAASLTTQYSLQNIFGRDEMITIS